MANSVGGVSMASNIDPKKPANTRKVMPIVPRRDADRSLTAVRVSAFSPKKHLCKLLHLRTTKPQ
jgi:hypothetical protein